MDIRAALSGSPVFFSARIAATFPAELIAAPRGMLTLSAPKVFPIRYDLRFNSATAPSNSKLAVAGSGTKT